MELASPMFVGGLNPDRETFRLPPVIWSANLRLGFVGCMRDVVVNGRAIDIVDYAQKQDSGNEEGHVPSTSQKLALPDYTKALAYVYKTAISRLFCTQHCSIKIIRYYDFWEQVSMGEPM